MAQRRLLSTAALAAAVPVGRSREGASKTLQRIAFGGPFLPNTASSVYVGLIDMYAAIGGRTVCLSRGFESEVAAALLRRGSLDQGTTLARIAAGSVDTVMSRSELTLACSMDVRNPAPMDSLPARLDRAFASAGTPRLDYVFLTGVGSESDRSLFLLAIEQLKPYLVDGRVGSFGVAAKELSLPQSDRRFLSLSKLLAWTESAGARNYFGAVRMPLSAAHSHFIIDPLGSSRREGQTGLELAASEGIAVFAEDPLRGPAGNRLLRLQSFPKREGKEVAALLSEAFNIAIQVEMRYAELFKQLEPRQSVARLPPLVDLAWGQIISQNGVHLSSPDEWEGALAGRIQPTLNAAIAALRELPPFTTFCDQYRVATRELFARFADAVEFGAEPEAERVRAIIDRLSPSLARLETLEQKAFSLLLSAGVHTIVANQQMRFMSYFDGRRPLDIAACWRSDALVDRNEALAVLRGLRDGIAPAS